MSRSIGTRLPADLLALLDGRRLEERVGLTVLLLTTAEDGWTSVALLSVGEIVATGPSSLRLALWPGTTTTGNLARTGRATLAIFGEDLAAYVRIEAGGHADLIAGGLDLVCFDASIADILDDRVPYAAMAGGPSFELVDPASTIARWQATVNAMLARPQT